MKRDDINFKYGRDFFLLKIVIFDYSYDIN